MKLSRYTDRCLNLMIKTFWHLSGLQNSSAGQKIWIEAMIILNRLEKEYPDNSETYFRKAQVLSWKKEYEQSIRY